MKSLVLFLLFFVAVKAGADDMNDAFNSGTSYGSSNRSQGTGSLNNNNAVFNAIPGYSSNPSGSGYYGGVTGGDGGLASAGQSALNSNNIAQTVISSGTTNPAVNIPSNSPYITNGKSAESNADTIASGTNSQCTETTVSKSTFQSYTCSADVAVQESCTRDSVPSGYYVTQYTTSTVSVPPVSWHLTHPKSTEIDFQFPLTAGATIVSGTLTLVPTSQYAVSTYQTNFNFYGQVTRLTSNNMSFALNIDGKIVPDDGYLRGTITPNDPTSLVLQNYLSSLYSGIYSDAYPDDNYLLNFDAVITIVTPVQVFVPQVSTPSVCANNMGGTLINTTCSIPGGDRQVVVNGQTQTVHSDCWQYTDTYLVNQATTGTCSDLMNNSACTQSGSNCTETTDGICSHMQYTWQCQTNYTSTGLLCGGQYFCQSGSCNDTAGAGDSGFDTAVAKLAGLASAASDVKNDQINIKAFTGQAMSCRKAMAGFSNCCVDSGWGNSAGLANCNSDEMAIGKAKAKKVVVSVGEACNLAVLGVCIQKKQVYCVFGGKLARIIQEQGRRDQLGINFGSGDSPNCRGITVSELQDINFDLINFSDFYSDLIENQNIPDSSVMVQQVKDRIAAQVNAQTGGK
jgi:conjugal transfer mating pair stabilization protein TraN